MAAAPQHVFTQEIVSQQLFACCACISGGPGLTEVKLPRAFPMAHEASRVGDWFNAYFSPDFSESHLSLKSPQVRVLDRKMATGGQVPLSIPYVTDTGRGSGGRSNEAITSRRTASHPHVTSSGVTQLSTGRKKHLKLTNIGVDKALSVVESENTEQA